MRTTHPTLALGLAVLVGWPAMAAAPGPVDRPPVDADHPLAVFDRNLARGEQPAAEELLVALEPAASAVELAFEASDVGCWLDRTYGLRNVHHLTCPGATTAQALRDRIADLAALPGVANVEAGWPVTFRTLPNDSMYRMWHLVNNGQRIAGRTGTVGADVSAEQAWDITTGSPDVVIAVVDSGMSVTHDDLENNLWVNPGEVCGNGIDDDGNGYVDDCNGWDAADDDADVTPDALPATNDNGGNCAVNHGTFIAGTIAGEGNNGLLYTGLMWDASIMAVKAASDDGCAFNTLTAYGAMVYALDNGADVINASWGFGGDAPQMRQVFADAEDAGVVVAIAAGNDGRDQDTDTDYPTAYGISTGIVTAASTSNDVLAGFSNYGRTTVDLAAPGELMFSYSYTGDRAVELGSGTSYAAPLVAATAGLIWSAYPSLDGQAVRDAIVAGVDPIAAFDCATTTACVASGGRLNAETALRLAGGPDLVLTGWRLEDGVGGNGEGDGDARIELGEKVGMPFIVENVGLSAAARVQARLRLNNAFVPVEERVIDLGPVDVGERIRVTPGFQIELLMACEQDFSRTASIDLELFEGNERVRVWSTGRPLDFFCDVDEDGDGSPYPTDCDDAVATTFPGADELCNEVDDDCDGAIDEDAVDVQTVFPDADGDGFGDPAGEQVGCAVAGFVTESGDCNDGEPAINPAAEEVCNGLDDDCDGRIDVGAIDGTVAYRDADGDGYGDPEDEQLVCGDAEGYVTNADDCDDADADAWPGSPLRDDNCVEREPAGCACATAPTPAWPGSAFALLPLVALATLRRRGA